MDTYDNESLVEFLRGRTYEQLLFILRRDNSVAASLCEHKFISDKKLTYPDDKNQKGYDAYRDDEKIELKWTYSIWNKQQYRWNAENKETSDFIIFGVRDISVISTIPTEEFYKHVERYGLAEGKYFTISSLLGDYKELKEIRTVEDKITGKKVSRLYVNTELFLKYMD